MNTLRSRTLPRGCISNLVVERAEMNAGSNNVRHFDRREKSPDACG